MSTITDQLFTLLQTVKRPGNFCTSGTLEIFPPQLEVEGVGRIALPLLPAQAEQLIAVAEQAPYGRGQDTLVDTGVRRTWQIDAGRVALGGKHWQENLDGIVSRAAAGLGVGVKVRAELYKLLVYDAGSFFVSHRDTEKAPGMFATLVIVLPSLYNGGELIVRRREDEVKLELRCSDPSEVAFAAFYADCLHEVLPVTEGCRLTLIYNLIRTDDKLPLPKPPDYRREQETAAALLRDWRSQLNAEKGDALPEKLIYLLEHAYTSAELGFDTLKNADAAVADVLTAAAEQADCAIHLALVSVEESGSAEHSGYGGYGRSRRYWDDEEDDEFEIVEVCDRLETVADWRAVDGSWPALPTLPFNKEEFCPPEAFEDMEPDEVHFHEATGNEGASFERTYRSAALVLWPHSRYLAIVNQAGLRAALPVLAELCRQWEANGKPAGSNDWRAAHILAGYMLRDWLPSYCGPHYVYSTDSSIRDFLNYLYDLSDRDLLAHFWNLLAEKGFYNKHDAAMLVRSAELLPWPQVANSLTGAIAASAVKAQAQEACAALLAGFSAVKSPAEMQALGAAAQALFAALPGDAERFPQLQPWERPRMTAGADLAADVLQSFGAIDAALAETALDYMLAWPDCYGMDSVLLPAALRLTETAPSRRLPVAARLRSKVMAHLEARIAEVLQTPGDWRRNSQLKCGCQDCAELSRFLDNPDQAQWSFKAVEARRKHVEESIRSNRCDVDCKTDSSKRPYSLICTKNQASYRRRVEQRKNDLEALEQLRVE